MNLSPRTIKILAAVILIIISLWVVVRVLGFLIFGPKPPRPEITQGEFNFRLEYEVDGERFVIEDAMIAEFDGFSSDTGIMRWYRTWHISLASDRNLRNILLHELDDGRRIYYVIESANYFMGDLQGEREPNPNWYPFNGVTMEYPRNQTPEIGAEFIDGPEDLYNRFGIRLISWEHDPPIINSFE